MGPLTNCAVAGRTATSDAKAMIIAENNRFIKLLLVDLFLQSNKVMTGFYPKRNPVCKPGYNSYLMRIHFRP